MRQSCGQVQAAEDSRENIHGRRQEDRWSREVRRGTVCRAEYKRIERGTYDESSNIYNRYGHL